MVIADDNPTPLQYDNTMAITYPSLITAKILSFMQVINMVNGQAHKIKCRYYLILQVFLSVTKPAIQYAV